MVAVESVPLRSGTTAEWGATTLILGVGELGLDTDAGVIRVGDGGTPFADLPDFGGGGGGFILDGTTTVSQIVTTTPVELGNTPLMWDDLPDEYSIDGGGSVSGVPAGAYIAWVEIDYDTIDEDRLASLFVSVSGAGTGCNVGPLYAAADPSYSGSKVLYASGTIVVPEGATVTTSIRSGVVNATENPTPDPWSVLYASLLLAQIG